MTEAKLKRDSVSDRRVTMGEIAEIAGVGPSAVSNWRQRHSDFPVAAEKSAAGELFRLGEVVTWLRGHGKEVDLPSRSTERQFEEDLWKWYDSVRGFFFPALLLDLPLQLLLLRRCSELGEAATVSRFWGQVGSADSASTAGVIQDALHAMADLHPELTEALKPPYALEQLESDDLLNLVHLVASLDLTETAATGPMVSRFIESFSLRTGAQGSDHFTPQGIRDLMLELLQPITGSIYDPACGAALLLAEAWRLRSSGGAKAFGQEINQDACRTGVLNLALNGADFDVRLGDTLARDLHFDLRADRIALDPPLGAKPTEVVWLEKDPRWKYGLPGTSGELAWAQHLVWHLEEDGGIGVQLCTPSVLASGGHDASIRGHLLGADVVDAVVQLPEGVLPKTKIGPALIIFDQNRANRHGKVLFVDARELGQAERGGLYQIGSKDIETISAIVRKWRKGRFSAETAFSASATVSRLEGTGWNLSPRSYVQYLSTPLAIKGEPIPDRFFRLADALGGEIRDVLEVLGSLGTQLDSIGQADKIGEWPVHDLGDLLVSRPITGIRGKSKTKGAKAPFVETSLVSGGEVVLASAPLETASRPSKARLTQPGDLLLVVRGVDREKPASCARVAFDEPAAFAGSLARLRANSDLVLPDYLRLFLTSRKGLSSLRAVATGTVITNVSQAALLRVRVPVPPLERQREVVEAIAGLEAAMTTVEQLVATIREHHDTVREGLIGGLLKLQR